MKIFKTLLVASLMFFASILQAQTFEIDGIHYKITDKEKKVAEVSSAYPSKYSGDIIIPENVSYNNVTYTVKFINYTFTENKEITSITLPSSIECINNRAFENCINLKQITLPDGIKKIETQAFYGCTSLTSIRIPKSVVSIVGDAFYGCSSLDSITVDSGNPIFDSRNNCNAIINTKMNGLHIGSNRTIIPDSILIIGNGAFYGRNLTSIRIPKDVIAISGDAFWNCSSLDSITVDSDNPIFDSRNNSNAIINTKMNGLHTGSNRTIIPDSILIIGNGAFYGRNLTSIRIPKDVIAISGDAFWNCSSLDSITVDSGNPIFDSRNNCNAIINTKMNGLHTGSNRTIIPDSILIIGNGAFYGRNLTSIRIPKSVAKIANDAFWNCSLLDSITVDSGNPVFDSRNNCNAIIETRMEILHTGSNRTIIPEGARIISEGAFYGRGKLTDIVIPESVEIIKKNAFRECLSLESITIPETIEPNEYFTGCDNLKEIKYGDKVLTVTKFIALTPIEEPLFQVLDEQPEFPGGVKAFVEYVKENLQYPRKCRNNNIQGKVYVNFIVDKEGNINNIEVMKSSGNIELDQEAIRVVKNMPKWKPGKIKGENVHARFTVPIAFILQ